MEKLRKTDKDYLKGYARALQDMMFKLTGDNTCGKSYDPIDFCDEKIHSYAFDLKDGGRHHPLKDYKDSSAHHLVLLLTGIKQTFVPPFLSASSDAFLTHFAKFLSNGGFIQQLPIQSFVKASSSLLQ